MQVRNIFSRFSFALVFSTWLMASALAAGPTGLLNDTGQTKCDDGSNAMVTCTGSLLHDLEPMPRQDSHFGRDRAYYTKIGGGVAGFDLTRVCMDGSLNCNPAAVDTGYTPPSTAWACTKDNVTNLIWSLYTFPEWRMEAANMAAYPVSHNDSSRCGFNTGWRVPTRRELVSIVNLDGSVPTIDAAYFPDTESGAYWTNEVPANHPTSAFTVTFADGRISSNLRINTNFIRLVRSGQ